MPTTERYGARWTNLTDLQIEFGCILKGGSWTNKAGVNCGAGLFAHYKRAQELLWPKAWHHRWSDLMLQEFLNNTITCIVGAKDTGKTHCMARFALVDYFVFPDNTLIIVSSTTLAALEKRVWGEIKTLFSEAKQLHEWLPGVVIDSKHALCTDDLTDESVIARDMRRGIAAVPCKNSSGAFVNISDYVGIKQERRRHIGDEFQFMSAALLDAIANANSGEWKGIFAGNPIGQGEPLDQLSEPENGWDSLPEPTKTTVWKNRRFLRSNTICLYGPDSPNFDDPPNRYKKLINQASIDNVVAGYGRDSHQYYSQVLGVRKAGLEARRVITRSICKKFNTFEDALWEGSQPTTKIAALDAAYSGSGGDRAVGGHIEFGKCTDGKIRVQIHEPVIVQYSLKSVDSPEDQISWWVRTYCELHGIPPEHFFYDSTGRGTLGPSLARIWSAHIQPVEFGGVPTSRPVSMDFSIIDDKTKQRRLKTCREHYSKFVSELWFSVRYAIEADQVRGMNEVLLQEGCAREWKETAGNKVEVEGKGDLKERVGYSPDHFDWLVTCVEGARRKGFQISKLANQSQSQNSLLWFSDLARDQERVNRERELVAI